jgi:hypothetical protein
MFLFDFPPPVRYDHSCNHCGVVVKPLAALRETCAAMGVRSTRGLLFGCSWRGPAGCTIIIPALDSEITQSEQNMVRRAEDANCNGWPRGNRE